MKLIQGKKYIINVHTTWDDLKNTNHPLLNDIIVTYIGKDTTYEYGESHIFIRDTFVNPFKYKEQLDLLAYLYLTCICHNDINVSKQEFKIHICLDKISIHPFMQSNM